MIRGSALKAGENPTDDDSAQPIMDLVQALDDYVPMPDRPKDKPFLMPVEDVFSITGRGTVGTGRIERGVINVGVAWRRTSWSAGWFWRLRAA